MTEDDNDERWVMLHAAARSELASYALGESLDPAVDAHVRDCPVCLREVAAFRSTIDVARDIDRDDVEPAPVPAHVWDGILGELGIQPEPELAASEPVVAAPAVPAAPRWRRGLVAAAAVVGLAAAGVAGWAIGHITSPGSPDRSSQAALVAQPGTSSVARGTAVMHRSDVGYTMTVTTAGLPAPQGYYEVWLFDPSANRMVAVGTLGAGARGSFTVPAGLDLAAYHVIDVSAQKFDGNPAHQRSVLRGPITR